MLDALQHRGPDGSRSHVFRCGGRTITLGATRLAVIDRTPAGLMPLLDPASGSAIVFNGELYNYRELRAQLDVPFRSETDTEVALQALLAWGPEALRRFRGMYALGLWNQVEGALLLARDSVGKKPLYYAALPRGLVFCSEVRAMLASGLLARRLDDEGVLTYLANGFSVAPATLVRGIRSLMPGTVMEVGADGTCRKPSRYWALPPPGEPPSDLAAVLRQAVRRRLHSDAPLGILLSSGVDSTAVAGIVRTLVDRPVHAFTVGTFDPEFDEAPLAARFAAQLGLVHHVHRIEAADLDGAMRAALAALDQPSFDGPQLHIACAAARQAGWTVLLAGAGADELFAGYGFILQGSVVHRLRRLPPAQADGIARAHALLGGWFAGRIAEARATAELPAALRTHQSLQALFSPGELARLVGRDLPEAAVRSWGLPAEFVRFVAPELECRRGIDALTVAAWRLYLGERQLRDGDQMSMASSIELRGPFLDQDFVAAAMAVPARQRTAGRTTKRYERRLVAPLLPARLRVPLRKRGFAVPIARWMDGEGPDGGLDRRALERIGLSGPIGGRRPLSWRQRWAIFVLANWAERHRLAAG